MSAPILKRFKISKLHGYKDVEIGFEGIARILIAGNGSGKTTIFNALFAVLSGRFHRLQALDFTNIECVFSNNSSVTVQKSQIRELSVEAYKRIGEVTSPMPDVEAEEVAAFLLFGYELGNIEKQRDSEPLLRLLYTHMPGDYAAVGEALDALAYALRSSTPEELRNTGAIVRAAMGSTKVLYLPTYRRIELPLRAQKKLHRGLLGNASEEQIFAESSPDTKHINFGLADVERRLGDLSEMVERDSNFEYRNISATILDEALAGRITAANIDQDQLPDIQSLRIFLARVSQDGHGFAWGYFPASRPSTQKNDRRISAIESLYKSGQILGDEQVFLRYFLTRLSSVIERTKQTETMLQRFVDACNEYLRESTDEKIFSYDQTATRVRVINSWNGEDISLGNLSSGEKQVVSILARLYLYDEKRFVLIDEPELSLSLEWQKKILPDILESGSVTQLFAITHSPFIFDNALDPYAGPLKASRHSQEQAK